MSDSYSLNALHQAIHAYHSVLSTNVHGSDYESKCLAARTAMESILLTLLEKFIDPDRRTNRRAHRLFYHSQISPLDFTDLELLNHVHFFISDSNCVASQKMIDVYDELQVLQAEFISVLLSQLAAEKQRQQAAANQKQKKNSMNGGRTDYVIDDAAATTTTSMTTTGEGDAARTGGEGAPPIQALQSSSPTSLEETALRNWTRSLVQPELVRAFLERMDELIAQLEFLYIQDLGKFRLRSEEEVARVQLVAVMFVEAVRWLRSHEFLRSPAGILECHTDMMLALPRLAIFFGCRFQPNGPLSDEILFSNDEAASGAAPPRLAPVFHPVYPQLCVLRRQLWTLAPFELIALLRLLLPPSPPPEQSSSPPPHPRISADDVRVEHNEHEKESKQETPPRPNSSSSTASASSANTAHTITSSHVHTNPHTNAQQQLEMREKHRVQQMSVVMAMMTSARSDLQKLFKLIASVSDQLQSEFAADYRYFMKVVYDVVANEDEDDDDNDIRGNDDTRRKHDLDDDAIPDPDADRDQWLRLLLCALRSTGDVTTAASSVIASSSSSASSSLPNEEEEEMLWWSRRALQIKSSPFFSTGAHLNADDDVTNDVTQKHPLITTKPPPLQRCSTSVNTASSNKAVTSSPAIKCVEPLVSTAGSSLHPPSHAHTHAASDVEIGEDALHSLHPLDVELGLELADATTKSGLMTQHKSATTINSTIESSDVISEPHLFLCSAASSSNSTMTSPAAAKCHELNLTGSVAGGGGCITDGGGRMLAQLASLLLIAQRPMWRDDASSLHCNHCRKRFGGLLVGWMWHRRHHCRRCGHLFCANCWGGAMRRRALPTLQIFQPVPICVECDEYLIPRAQHAQHAQQQHAHQQPISVAASTAASCS